MLSLILIRHGQTDWNTEGRIQGRTDIPLNAAGRAQAQTLKDACGHLTAPSAMPYTVLSSPLSRALETARIALGEAALIATDERLMEIDYGSWGGVPGRILEETQPEACQRWFGREDIHFCPHGGESWAALEERIAAFHHAVVVPQITDARTRLILFSHGAFISQYLNFLLNARGIFSTLNASISEVVLHPGRPPRLHVFNYIAECLNNPFWV